MNILTEIAEKVRAKVEEQKRRLPLSQLKSLAGSAPEQRGLAAALSRPGINIIAEIKRASPSAGLLSEHFEPAAIARMYAGGGAAAISVLTEQDYFLGSLDHLLEARRAVDLPALRKDFILDDYQIYESRAGGADAILLIVALLDRHKLAHLIELAGELGLEALVEVHTASELETALQAGAQIVGVNNRDLRDFKVSLNVSLELARLMPENIIKVSESGIKSLRDIVRLRRAGFDGFLIGEQLMRASDPRQALRALLAAGRASWRAG